MYVPEKLGEGFVKKIGEDPRMHSQTSLVRVYGNVTDGQLVSRFGGTFGGSVVTVGPLTMDEDGTRGYILKRVTAYAE